MSTETDSNSNSSGLSHENSDFKRLKNDPNQRSSTYGRQARKDARRESSWLDKKDWKKELIVAGTLLAVSFIDALLFMAIDNWAAPLVVGAIQLLAALIFAKNYGVEEIPIWLNKVIDKFPSNGNGKDQPKDDRKQ